jgi:acetylornithine deacetylase/succinyl-diaminopimelate desuccinylase-like protein
MNSVVELCQALVQIPSENPNSAPGSQGEAALAEFVGDFLARHGAEVTYEEVLAERSNVCGWFKHSNSGPRLLFAPHLDTVPGAGMTIDPFGGEMRDGRIYGRGASDTKGTMAAMLWAITQTDLTRVDAQVGFIGLVDEEMDQLGSIAAAKTQRADLVIAGEPTELNVVYTHKGTCWLRLEATGKAAHGSLPERGINAIDVLTIAYHELQIEFPNLCPVEPEPLLGPPTCSIGKISGGTKINIVPDRASAEIDIRTLPGQEHMLQSVQAFLAEKHPAVAVHPIKISQPLYCDPSNPLIQRLVTQGSLLKGATWFCDAAFFAAAGTPSIALGPGSILQGHTADEYITIADLEAGATFFQRYLEGFAR